MLSLLNAHLPKELSNIVYEYQMQYKILIESKSISCWVKQDDQLKMYKRYHSIPTTTFILPFGYDVVTIDTMDVFRIWKLSESNVEPLLVMEKKVGFHVRNVVCLDDKHIVLLYENKSKSVVQCWTVIDHTVVRRRTWNLGVSVGRINIRDSENIWLKQNSIVLQIFEININNHDFNIKLLKKNRLWQDKPIKKKSETMVLEELNWANDGGYLRSSLLLFEDEHFKDEYAFTERANATSMLLRVENSNYYIYWNGCKISIFKMDGKIEHLCDMVLRSDCSLREHIELKEDPVSVSLLYDKLAIVYKDKTEITSILL